LPLLSNALISLYADKKGYHLLAFQVYSLRHFSCGEENIFVWSFFLAIAQLAIDNDENYKWVKTIYIDDPISSLDDNNVIIVSGNNSELKPYSFIKFSSTVLKCSLFSFTISCGSKIE
jgi:wobble nucleotide-excising tRNase